MTSIPKHSVLSKINYLQFDGFEVHPMCLLDEQNKVRLWSDRHLMTDDWTVAHYTEHTDVLDDTDPNVVFWTICGHTPESGLMSLVDYRSKEMADAICDLLRLGLNVMDQTLPDKNPGQLLTDNTNQLKSAVPTILKSDDCPFAHECKWPDGCEAPAFFKHKTNGTRLCKEHRDELLGQYNEILRMAESKEWIET